jgi:TRAP-type C4-dicarboxylate transport system permease small subunit
MPSNFDRFLTTGPYAAAAVGLLGIVLLISAAILSRNFAIRTGGLQTIAQLIGVWLAFVVAGGLAHQQRHIAIDFFTDKFPARIQRLHAIVVAALNLLMCLVLAWGGVLAAQRFWDSTAPNAPIPIPLYYAAVVLGGILLLVAYGRQLLDALGVERAARLGGDLE